MQVEDVAPDNMDPDADQDAHGLSDEPMCDVIPSQTDVARITDDGSDIVMDDMDSTNREDVQDTLMDDASSTTMSATSEITMDEVLGTTMGEMTATMMDDVAENMGDVVGMITNVAGPVTSVTGTITDVADVADMMGDVAGTIGEVTGTTMDDINGTIMNDISATTKGDINGTTTGDVKGTMLGKEPDTTNNDDDSDTIGYESDIGIDQVADSMVDGVPDKFKSTIQKVKFVTDFDREMQPGFSLVFGNTQKLAQVKPSTGRYHTQVFPMHLWTNAYAAQHRVHRRDLDNNDTVLRTDEIPLSSYLHNGDDEVMLRNRMETVVSRILVKHLPFFKKYCDLAERHIEHEHSDESAQKSKFVS